SAFASASGSYSLRFAASSVNPYIGRTPSVSGDPKKYTLSMWVKRSAVSDGGTHQIYNVTNSAGNGVGVSFTSTDALRFVDSSVTADKITTAVFRDPSMWYHIVVAVDTSQATAANRNRIYVNGVE